MTTPAKTTPARKSTPAQVFDFNAIAVEDAAAPRRASGRTGEPIPDSIVKAVTDSWSNRERRANGRYVGKGKQLPGVPGSEVKRAMAFLRRAGLQIGVGVGMQVQDRTGKRVDVKELSEKASYRVVFAAQTPKAKKNTNGTS